ncbi:hypothetical protein F4778DRAFT_735619 [Xylariomycetidae sp. FL2044]|nr:hypothetical protein F4778DRAFT_735619 [Xylariomycetidae sp. FL2044]
MEAIAAAGALPGLASATIQLGTTAFQFYQQIRSLRRAIREGENDLATASRRLRQHEEFIQELRFNFDRIPVNEDNRNATDLFSQYIIDCEGEVNQFKELLEQIGKHRFRGKTIQKLETGTRLRFNQDDVRRYCDILDTQMTRFLFFQSSFQQSQVSDSLSGIEDTLERQDDRATAIYTALGSTVQHMENEVLSRLQTIHHDLKTVTCIRSRSEDEKRHRTRAASSPTGNALLVPTTRATSTRKYLTLCGWVAVTTYHDNELGLTYPNQFFVLRFEPFGWIFKSAVEWRCCMQVNSSLPSLMLSTTIDVRCTDEEVLDALGFVKHSDTDEPCDGPGLWHKKAPDPRRLRTLLDDQRLVPGAILDVPHYTVQRDVLTAIVGFHHNCGPGDTRGVCRDYCSMSGSAYHLDSYMRYYQTVKLLLNYRFRPRFSDWNSLFALAANSRVRIAMRHPDLRNSEAFAAHSVPLMIQEAAGYLISTPCGDTFFEEMAIKYPRTLTSNTGAFWYTLYGAGRVRPSLISSLLCLSNCANVIRREIFDFETPDLASDEYSIDRCLLVLFSHSDPALASLLEEYLRSYRKTANRHMFSLEYVCREIENGHIENSHSENWFKRNLIRYILVHGSLSTLSLLLDNEVTVDELTVLDAGQSCDPRKLDLILASFDGKNGFLEEFPHTRLTSHRLDQDADFRRSLIERFVQGSTRHPRRMCAPRIPNASSFVCFLLNPMTIDLLWLNNQQDVPNYFQSFFNGCLSIYETNPQHTEVPVLCYLLEKAMNYHIEHGFSAEEILRPLYLYHTMKQLVSLRAIRARIDDACPEGKGCQVYRGISVHTDPATVHHTALMLALHMGMLPAVQILVDAGASIISQTKSGKSPLDIAYKNNRCSHPRRWYKTVPCPDYPDRRRSRSNELWVSESTDAAMLKILLEALRERGEEDYVGGLKKTLSPSKWEQSRTKAVHLLGWLFKPSYKIDTEAVRQNAIYAVTVITLTTLSILKIVHHELGGYIPGAVRFLSRPVVAFAIVIWMGMWLFR